MNKHVLGLVLRISFEHTFERRFTFDWVLRSYSHQGANSIPVPEIKSTWFEPGTMPNRIWPTHHCT